DVEVERAELSLLLEAEPARAAGDDSPAGGKELLGVVFEGRWRLPGLGVAKAEAGRRSGSLEIGVARRRCGLRPGDNLHQRVVLGRLRRFRLRRPSGPVVMMLMHRCVPPPETAREQQTERREPAGHHATPGTHVLPRLPPARAAI